MYSTESSSKILKHNLILLGIVVALFFINYYSKTLFFRPNSIHQWRQTDCLSIAKNYYEEGMHFFQPKIHYQGTAGGKSVSECPILNYSAAILWKIFGEHEFIYRLMEYLIFITSIFVLFNTLLRFYKSAILSHFATGLLLTSPLLTYYGPNFIADVPALSLGIISFCLFFNFYHNKRTILFYLSVIVGTLAVLIKASALIALGVILFFTIIDLVRLNGIFRTQRLFEKKLIPVISLLFSLTVIIAWYRFALAYNRNDADDVFLLTVLPIWDMEKAERIHSLKVLFNEFFPLFLNKPMLFLFFCLVIYVSVKLKELDTFFKYTFIFSGIFFILYIFFFFRVFSLHDYYLVNLMIFPVITLLSFISHVSRTRFLIDNGKFVIVLVIVIYIGNALHSAAIYRLRTINQDSLVDWFPFISEEEKKLFAYLFWDYSKNVKNVENITPQLRAAGIKRTDMVLSVPDGSFDISLYMMDQKGYTIAQDHLENDTTVMDRFLPKVKYLVLSDTLLKQKRAFKRLYHRLEPLYYIGPVQVLRVKPVI